MRILTFNYEYPPVGGGGGVVHALIAEELAKRHDVAVVTSAYDDLPRFEVRGGVDVHRVPVVGRSDTSAASLSSMLSYPPAAWWHAAKLFRTKSFDLINSHFAVPTGPASLPVARLGRIPHVLSIHGGDIFDPSKTLSPHRLPVVRSAVSRVMSASDAVVAQSTNTRANAYRYYRYSGPIEIIPLGIRQPPETTATRDELGVPQNRFVAITVGRLVKRKGIDELLRCLLKPECSELHLVVVGAGPEYDFLVQLAGELGVEDRVQFTGFVSAERKWQLLRCADAYVSATLHEGFGLVYLEGMAAGIPIVTYDHGGQVDFLEDGETGFLVPLGDVEGLADAMARLISDPAEAARMGRANLDRAPGHRIEECAAEYEQLFENILREGEAKNVVTNS